MGLYFADSLDGVSPGSHQAIVTLAVGERYQACWEHVSRPGWMAYADRHGLDVIVAREPLDGSSFAAARSIAWQKCLLPMEPWARRYRRLCWVDADILVNPHAPDIFADVPADKIGATLVHDQLSESERHILLERAFNAVIPQELFARAWAQCQLDLYAKAGIPTQISDMVQTGVLVFSPERDAEIFAAAYRRTQASVSYEQPSLSFEILSSGRMHRMSARWNWGFYDAVTIHHPDLIEPGVGLRDVPERLVAVARTEALNAYFLHFYHAFHVLERLRA